jgi:hypothetical protein
VSRRYIDADLPCVSDDRPTRAELAAERDSEKYDEGYSDGKVAGYDEGHSDGVAEGRTQIREQIMELIEELLDDAEGGPWGDGILKPVRAAVISEIRDALMALADDAEVAGE